MNFEIYPGLIAAAVYQSFDIAKGEGPADDKIVEDLFARYDEMTSEPNDLFYTMTCVEYVMNTHSARYWERYGALLDFMAADIGFFNQVQRKGLVRATQRMTRADVQMFCDDNNTMIGLFNEHTASQETKH